MRDLLQDHPYDHQFLPWRFIASHQYPQNDCRSCSSPIDGSDFCVLFVLVPFISIATIIHLGAILPSTPQRRARACRRWRCIVSQTCRPTDETMVFGRFESVVTHFDMSIYSRSVFVQHVGSLCGGALRRTQMYLLSSICPRSLRILSYSVRMSIL